MNKQINFSDEELTAYLDGQFGYTRQAEIESAIKNDRDLQEQIDALSIDKDDIKNAFDGLLSLAPEQEIPEPRSNNVFQASWALSPAIAAAVALVFFSFGWVVKPSETVNSISGWKSYAAAYQALYINSTLAHIDSDEEELNKELARVSAALGKDLELDKLQSFDRLDYKRSQILGFNGQPLIQLAFLNTMDAPVALCIMRSKEDVEKAIELAEIEGMSSAAWEKDGFRYLLIGGKDSILIEEAANALSNVI